MSAAILNACSLSDMWKYVCNSMECHLHCCRDFITCDFKTNEIEIEPDNNKCTFGEIISHCCIERNDDDQ